MTKSKYSLLFSISVFLVLIWMAWEATRFQKIASYFPLYIALFAIVLIVINLIMQIKDMIKNTDDEEKLTMQMTIPVIKYILWFVGYLVLMLFVGFLIGTVIFLFLFLVIESRIKLFTSIFIVAVTIAAVIHLGRVMDLKWPTGMIGF